MIENDLNAFFGFMIFLLTVFLNVEFKREAVKKQFYKNILLEAKKIFKNSFGLI